MWNIQWAGICPMSHHNVIILIGQSSKKMGMYCVILFVRLERVHRDRIYDSTWHLAWKDPSYLVDAARTRKVRRASCYSFGRGCNVGGSMKSRRRTCKHARLGREGHSASSVVASYQSRPLPTTTSHIHMLAARCIVRIWAPHLGGWSCRKMRKDGGSKSVVLDCYGGIVFDNAGAVDWSRFSLSPCSSPSGEDSTATIT